MSGNPADSVRAASSICSSDAGRGTKRCVFPPPSPVESENFSVTVLPGGQFVQLFGRIGGCALIVHHHAVTRFAVETVDFVVDQSGLFVCRVLDKQPLGDDARRDAQVVVFARHASEASFQCVCEFAPECLQVGVLLVADDRHVAVSVVGFHYEAVGQGVEIDGVGTLPDAVLLVEHPAQPALADVFPHAVFVGQQRPARSVGVQQHPEDLFVAGGGIFQIGLPAEALFIAQAQQFFVVVTGIPAFKHLPPFAQQEWIFPLFHKK